MAGEVLSSAVACLDCCGPSFHNALPDTRNVLDVSSLRLLHSFRRLRLHPLEEAGSICLIKVQAETIFGVMEVGQFYFSKWVIFWLADTTHSLTVWTRNF